MARDRHRWDPRCTFPGGLVRPVPVDPKGRLGPTRAQARGPAWRATSHGLYVPTATDSTIPEQRVLESAVLLPLGGAVTGWGSLRFQGGGFFDGLMPDGRSRRPVLLVAGRGQARRRRDGVRWLQDRLDPAETLVRHGVRCTAVERALFDEMRLSSHVRDAVAAMDMAAAAQLTSILRQRAYVDGHAGWAGVQAARAALDLADEHSRSPRETEMRLMWVLDAKLPRPLVNKEIFDLRTGALLGVADLLDPEAAVVGEFDGGEHAAAGRRSHDARRDGAFRDHGLEVFRVTSVDLARPREVVERARAAYRRAMRLPRGPRTWTLEAPPGWETPRSLDEILDERDLVHAEHERWLREGDPDITELRGY